MAAFVVTGTVGGSNGKLNPTGQPPARRWRSAVYLLGEVIKNKANILKINKALRLKCLVYCIPYRFGVWFNKLPIKTATEYR